MTGTDSLNVLLLLAFPEAIRRHYLERLRAAFPGLEINLVEHHSKVDPYIAEADVLITFGAHMADHVLEKGTRLRWVQALGTGVDGIADRPVLRDGVIVTNLRGHQGPAVSEAALALMLALTRDMRRTLANQREGRWERFPATLLRDKTVGILGLGTIAEALAARCAAFEMRVIGISAARRSAPGFARVWPREQLVEAAGEVDFLVLLAPYTAATHGIVNDRVLAAMKPTSYLINVARGAIVDEPALVRALEQRTIAGAGLDVFAEEPLPPGHPLWGLENVLITPHTAGFHVDYADEALPVVEENLRRFLAGETDNLINLVRA
jgi:D-2-hydroxyacid dehydrogenase (NADP+)